MINKLKIELGIFKDETKAELLGMIKSMIHRYGIDSLILGCTEFPIMFTEEKYLEIPFLNTTKIHIEKIINECLNNP